MVLSLATAALLWVMPKDCVANEAEWSCRQSRECLDLLPTFPLDASQTARLAQLATVQSRLQDRLKRVDPGAAATADRELAVLSEDFLRVASDCRDIADAQRCRKPRSWVDGIVASIEFRPGIPRQSMPAAARAHATEFSWNDTNRDLARRWVREILCTSSIPREELEGFRGFVLYSSSCMRGRDVGGLLPWILGGSPDVCSNIIYNARDRRVHLSADFFLNARMQTPGQEVEDVSVRLFEHEMAHHREFHLPGGKAELEEFTALRFKALGPKYRAELLALAAKYADGGGTIEAFGRDWVDLHKRLGVPTRWGDGTNHVLCAGLRSFGAGTLDSHSIENGHEYFAVAMELYRHDRKRAQEVYSREELDWLARHCRS